MGIGKFSPLKFPDALKQYASENSGNDSGTGEETDPRDAWDPETWKNPDSGGGILSRIIPSHHGQWMVAFAVLTAVIGFSIWAFKFFPGAYRNGTTLIATLWPASVALAYLKGREDGIRAIASAYSDLEWAVLDFGSTAKVLPGRVRERFGKGNHYRFNPLKGRSYGGFQFSWLKLGDLPGDRDRLMQKAADEKRGPEDPANYTLPGPLCVETTNSVLKKVIVCQGTSDDFQDSGLNSDMRVSAPSEIDEDRGRELAQLLDLYDNHILPAMMNEISTLKSLIERKEDIIREQNDPRLEEIYRGIDRLTNLANKNTTGGNQNQENHLTQSELDEKAGVGSDD